MLDTHVKRGTETAIARFKVAAGAPAGILDRLRTFGSGQLGAAKDLFHNVRGGLGGAYSPAFMGQGEGAFAPMAQASHRAMALQNVKTLAPSLAIGGGAYLLHRHNQEQDRQRAMMAQQGYGQGMM